MLDLYPLSTALSLSQNTLLFFFSFFLLFFLLFSFGRVRLPFFATVTNKLSRHAGHSSGQTVAGLIALSLFPCVHCLDLILEVERSEAIGRRSVKHQLSFFWLRGTTKTILREAEETE